VVTIYVTETIFVEHITLQLLCGYNLCNRKNVSRVYNVADIVWLQFMQHNKVYRVYNVAAIVCLQFMQQNNISRVYNVAAIVWLQFI
jgi:hypothetical protein